MSNGPRTDVAAGEELPTIETSHAIATSILYAGASGDFNPLHYDAEVAAGISPTGGVIAHGMYSMGLASRLLTSWAGGPEHVESIEVRFTKPWPTGSSSTFGGTVKEVADGKAVVALWGQNENGTRILSGTGIVRLG